MNSIKVGNYTIELSNTDKVLFPQDKITKGDIINYYHDISELMLKYGKNHPISMLRYPNGISQEGFYQKDAPTYFPRWITRVAVPKENGKLVHYVVLDKTATIVYLANQGCLIPHIWLSTHKKLNFPDRMIFDLDPSTKNFSEVVNVAHKMKILLEHCRLVPYIMTTGSRGLHIVVPLKMRDDFDTVREFARSCAELLERLNPKLITTEVRIVKRGKKVFIDYLRNAFTATAVAPYAVRAKRYAPVATPLFWDELKNSKLISSQYTINTIQKKLQRDGDPWKDFKDNAATLSHAIKIVNAMMKD